MHATAVAFGNDGILIRGLSGSGKSTLALELIEQPGSGLGQDLLHAKLVSDDRTVLEEKDNGIWLSAPANLRRKLEIRGLGIVDVKNHCASAKLALVVDLSADAERMPNPQQHIELLGKRIPHITLPMEAGALASRVRVALLHAKSAVAPAGM